MTKSMDTSDLLMAEATAIVCTIINKEKTKAELRNPSFKTKLVQNCFMGDTKMIQFASYSKNTGLMKDISETKN